MILKIIGMLLIFISCVLSGLILGEKYKKRVEELILFQRFVERIETEIMYTSTPILEIMGNYKDKIAHPFNQFIDNLINQFKNKPCLTFADVWKDSLDITKNLFSFNKNDFELLIYFGTVLGSSDKENQKKYFILIKKRLEDLLRDAQRENEKNRKLYKELGIIVGLLINIILI